MTRRDFIGGSIAAGAFSSIDLLYASDETPNLTIGVVSDLHINGPVGNPLGADERLFVKALEYFRGQGVDGVVIPGDLANCGLREDLKFIGETWRRVFPDDKLPNGRKVEKLFVTGNHDACGLYYARRSSRARQRTRSVLRPSSPIRRALGARRSMRSTRRFGARR